MQHGDGFLICVGIFRNAFQINSLVLAEKHGTAAAAVAAAALSLDLSSAGH